MQSMMKILIRLLNFFGLPVLNSRASCAAWRGVTPDGRTAVILQNLTTTFQILTGKPKKV